MAIIRLNSGGPYAPKHLCSYHTNPFIFNVFAVSKVFTPPLNTS